MKKTYSSKRVDAIDPKDILFANNDKNTVFDALSLKNIKKYKREFSTALPSGDSLGAPCCKRSRRKKYVKRLQHNISSNRSTLLTPDKSIYVNKPKDLFDMLKNDSSVLVVNRGKDAFDMLLGNSVNSSSKSSEALLKNTHRNKESSSDFKNYNLNIETKFNKTPKNTSIAKLVNDVSLIRRIIYDIPVKEESERISSELDPKAELLNSTPFGNKARNKMSLYNISPIKISFDYDKNDGKSSIICKEKDSNYRSNTKSNVNSSADIFDDEIYYEFHIKEDEEKVAEQIALVKKHSILVEEHKDNFGDSLEFQNLEKIQLNENSKKSEINEIEEVKTVINEDRIQMEELKIKQAAVLLENLSLNAIKPYIISSKSIDKSNSEKIDSLTEDEQINIIKDNPIVILENMSLNSIKPFLNNNESIDKSKPEMVDSDMEDIQMNIVDKPPTVALENMNLNTIEPYLSNNISIDSFITTNADSITLDEQINLVMENPVVILENMSLNSLKPYLNNNETMDESNTENEDRTTEDKQVSNLNKQAIVILENMSLNSIKSYLNKNECIDKSKTEKDDSVMEDIQTNKPPTVALENMSLKTIQPYLSNNESIDTSSTENVDSVPVDEQINIANQPPMFYISENVGYINTSLHLGNNESMDKPNTEKDYSAMKDKQISIVRKQPIVILENMSVNTLGPLLNKKSIDVPETATADNAIQNEQVNTGIKHAVELLQNISVSSIENNMKPFDKVNIPESVQKKISSKPTETYSKDCETSDEIDVEDLSEIKTNEIPNDCLNNAGTKYKQSIILVERLSANTLSPYLTENDDFDNDASNSMIDDMHYKLDTMKYSNTNIANTTPTKSENIHNEFHESDVKNNATLNESIDCISLIEELPNFNNFVTKRNRKPITDDSFIELDDDFDDNFEFCKPKTLQKQTINLLPGKKWGRSLSIYKRLSMLPQTIDLDDSLDDLSPVKHGKKYRQSIINVIELQKDRGSLDKRKTVGRSSAIASTRQSSLRIISESPRGRRVSGRRSIFTPSKETEGLLPDTWDETIAELSKLSISVDCDGDQLVSDDRIDRSPTAAVSAITPRDIVLRRCNQTDTITFDECFSQSALKNCRKIGEGVFGEVFMLRGVDGKARVVKLIPVAGDALVNGEPQRGWHEICAEVVIANELSNLRYGVDNSVTNGDDNSLVTTDSTDAFNQVLGVHLVHGSYPERLLELWDLFNESKGSENDRPDNLPEHQEYIVFELANAGDDLESFEFNYAEQALGVFYQVAYALAVAEEALQFEHRDLHWGNVLIAGTDETYVNFVLQGRTHTVPTRGVRATLIDYSLSRVTLPGANTALLFYDLESDPTLFEAQGDYQFDIYRLMRETVKKDWSKFEPYTNLLWLHYMLDKMITALRYRRINTKIHKQYIAKLKDLKGVILNYKSCVDFVNNHIFE